MAKLSQAESWNQCRPSAKLWQVCKAKCQKNVNRSAFLWRPKVCKAGVWGTILRGKGFAWQLMANHGKAPWMSGFSCPLDTIFRFCEVANEAEKKSQAMWVSWPANGHGCNWLHDCENIKLHCKAGEVGKMFGKPLSPEAPDSRMSFSNAIDIDKVRKRWQQQFVGSWVHWGEYREYRTGCLIMIQDFPRAQPRWWRRCTSLLSMQRMDLWMPWMLGSGYSASWRIAPDSCCHAVTMLLPCC